MWVEFDRKAATGAPQNSYRYLVLTQYSRSATITDHMSKPDRLFDPDPVERLASARALSREMCHKLQENSSEGAPVRPWPYGMPTVLNPWIVFVGPSPG